MKTVLSACALLPIALGAAPAAGQAWLTELSAGNGMAGTRSTELVPVPLTDDEACAMLQTRALEIGLELPMKLRQDLYRIRVSADCTARVYRAEDEAGDIDAARSPVWHDIEAGAWDAEICSTPLLGPLVDRGWRFLKKVALPDGTTAEFAARCDRHPR